ncbi:hypothetical protein JOE31_001894 [Arthrobacter sp. PvP023]|uniref:hypothetical protein n=1 Tax=Micrococcaceae TaxID=1268 RepID=UPI001AE5A47F|nr:hypothetical protein [Arthrobacter sp. PvP023]MBP1135662.1 hypothetical protein [Arthrobacter sp. PvP023]
MYKKTGITLPYSQEIIEPWPGVWQFDFKRYYSLAAARSARAEYNKANGIYNYEDAIYHYEEANNDD